MVATIPVFRYLHGPFGAERISPGQPARDIDFQRGSLNTHWGWSEFARRMGQQVFYGSVNNPDATPLLETATSWQTHFWFPLSLSPGRSRVGWWVDYQGQFEIGYRTLGSGGGYTTTSGSSTTRTTASGTLALTAGARYEFLIRTQAAGVLADGELYAFRIAESDASSSDLPS